VGQFGKACPKPLPVAAVRLTKGRAELRDDRREKAAVKTRDSYRCRLCKRKDGVDCHEHIRRGAGGQVELRNSFTLCRACHALVQTRHVGVEMSDGSADFDASQPLLFTMTLKVADLLFPRGDIPLHVHIIREGV